jgi:curli biogenesis system outer membrane secretion channel CsgG
MNRLWLLAFVCAIVVGCTNTATVTKGGGQTIAQARAENATGPKYRIAVGAIVDKSGVAGNRSLSQQIVAINKGGDKNSPMTATGILAGIRDMLVTELFGTGQFIVLDREDLNSVMVEQEFSHSARVGDTTRIPLGQLEGAELLVVGALTAFDTGAGSEGGALPIPVPLGRDAKYGWGLLNLSFKRGYAAMDLRIIDVATGRIVASTAVEGKNTHFGLNFTGLFDVGGNTIRLPGILSYFSNTPVEEALQKMVTAAIGTIAEQKPSQPQAAATTK